MKIISGGNSLWLITEFNILIIFWKFNKSNIEQICDIDLMDNYYNYKYAFNDDNLKFIFFNNDASNNTKVIKNTNYIITSEFLINLKNNNNTNNYINKNIINKTIEKTNPNKRHPKLKKVFYLFLMYLARGLSPMMN